MEKQIKEIKSEATQWGNRITVVFSDDKMSSCFINDDTPTEFAEAMVNFKKGDRGDFTFKKNEKKGRVYWNIVGATKVIRDDMDDTPTDIIDTTTKAPKQASKSQKTGTDKPPQEYWEAKDANITRIAIFKSTLEAVSKIYNYFTPSDVEVTLAEHLKIIGADVVEMTLSFEKALFKKEKK